MPKRWKNTKWRNKKKYQCPKCRSIRLARDGIVKGRQRYLCLRCGFRTIKPRGGNGRG